VRTRIRTLEDREAREERDIQAMRTKLSEPVILPTPNAVLAKALELDEPQPDGSYLVTGTFLPLVAVAETAKPPSGNPEALSVLYCESCAGRI